MRMQPASSRVHPGVFALPPAALILALATVASAHNPRVTLRVTKGTLPEIARALGEAADVPIWVETVDPHDPEGPGAAASPTAGPRHSVAWQDATLANALRELAGRFRVVVERRQGGYLLKVVPDGAELPWYIRPPTRMGLFEKEGLRLWVGSISITQSFPELFPQGQTPALGSPSVRLMLRGEWPEANGRAVVGFENITVEDDLGRIWLSDGWGTPRSNALVPQYPDEMLATVTLPLPPAPATKFRHVRGEIYVSQVRDSSQEVVVIPEAARVSGAPFSALGVQAIRFYQSGQLSKPSIGTERGLRAGLSVVLRTRLPGTPEDALAAFGHNITLGDALGRLHRSHMATARRDPGGRRPGVVLELHYSLVPFQPTRLVRVAAQTTAPRLLFPFRLDDIPLPLVDRSLPVVPRPVLLSEQTAEPPDDFPSEWRDPRGAQLTFGVEAPGLNAAEGRVRVGLAVPEGEDWSPAHWTWLPVDRTGVVRLEGVRPGRYRVYRVFGVPALEPAFPEGVSPASAGPGFWSGSGMEIQARAGEILRLPPLRRHAGTPGAEDTGPELSTGAARVEHDGVRLNVGNIAGDSTRQQIFREGCGPVGRRSISLRVGAPVTKEQSIHLAGIRALAAEDDRGTLLVPGSAAAEAGALGPPAGGALSRWRANPSFGAQHPLARRLTWVEGEILRYRTVRQVHLEMPCPTSEQPLTRKEGPVAIRLSRERSPDRDEVAAPPPPAGGNGALVSYIYRVQLSFPTGAIQPSPDGRFGPTMPRPKLVDRTGRVVDAGFLLDNTGSGRYTQRPVIRLSPPPLPPAEVAKLTVVWDYTERAQPEPWFRFRLRDVGLPALDRVLPPPAAVGPFTRVPDPPQPATTGSLAVRVRSGGRPVTEGFVVVGRRDMRGASLGPVRWYEALLTDVGFARFPNIPAGRYRIQVRYRPPQVKRGAVAASRPSLDRTTETEAEVTPGKQAELPPLNLSPGGREYGPRL